MNTVYFDSPVNDEVRRSRLYEGQLFVYSPRPSSLGLCEVARELVQEAFGSLDPRDAQYSLPAEEYVRILGELKPKFVHHPKAKQCMQEMLSELQCDLNKYYFDVPRLKTIPHGGDIASGLTYAFHPHRDTWYSAPMCQLNWWIPVYDIESESAMAFHPRYWSQPVRNGSSKFNHYQWNKHGRKRAAQDAEAYVREQPRPEEPIELDPQLRMVCPAGGIIVFSGAQLHSSVPNTSGRTRFSIDFRTVHLDDVAAQIGAPNIDTAATGTTLRDFLCGNDQSRIPDDVIALYDEEAPTDGELVFQPQAPSKP